MIKRCATCKEEKPVEEFCNDKGRADGKAIRCKACAKAKAAAYYLRNQEKIKKQVSEYKAQKRGESND